MSTFSKHGSELDFRKASVKVRRAHVGHFTWWNTGNEGLPDLSELYSPAKA